MREVSQERQATHGGCAYGMPRNLFTPLDVEPINVPLSSVTAVEGVVGLANTVETTAHRVKRLGDALRNLILGDEKLRTVAQVGIGGRVLGSIPTTSIGIK